MFVLEVIAICFIIIIFRRLWEEAFGVDVVVQVFIGRILLDVITSKNQGVKPMGMERFISSDFLVSALSLPFPGITERELVYLGSGSRLLSVEFI